MIFSRDYSRALLSLRQEDSRFCADRKGIFGRAVVEVKRGRAKTMLYAQGIQNGCICSLYLICRKNEGFVPLKAVLVNVKNGRAEVKWEFNPDNILGSGFKLEDVKALAVLTEKGEGVVTAYFDRPVDWKKQVRKNSACEVKAEDETKQPKSTVLNEEQPKEDKRTDNTAEAKKPESKKTAEKDTPPKAQKDFTEVVNRFRRDLDELRRYAYMEEAEKAEKAETRVKGEGISEVTMECVTKGRQTETPFGETGGEFRKISLKELCLIDGYMHKLENNPTVRSCYIKHGHLLYGEHNGKKLLCVPDEEREVLEGESLGFCGCENGYRIMKI